MLDTLKMLLGITGDTQDTLLQYYIDLSIISITNYLCREIDTGIDTQVVYLAKYYYTNRDSNSNSIQSIKQGQRSVAYNTTEKAIPYEIKMLLPLPSVRAGAL